MERDSPGTSFAALAFCWLPRVSLQRTWWQVGIGDLTIFRLENAGSNPVEFWSKCARPGGRDSSATPRITFGPFTHHGYQCSEPLCSNSVMPVSNTFMATRSNWVLQTFARFFEKFDLFVDILALYPDSTHVQHNILHNVWCLGALLRVWNEVLRLCIKKELWNLFNALVSPSPSWDWALVTTTLKVFNVFQCFFSLQNCVHVSLRVIIHNAGLPQTMQTIFCHMP